MNRLGSVLLLAGAQACIAVVGAPAALGQLAQNVSPRALQQQARIQELQRLELDTRLRINPEVPVGQRALIDYGGYTTFNYLSLDDPQHDNHILREYDLVGYARIQFDHANEIFLRGRIGYRDFNDQDSFDGRGDEPVDGDMDRAYYRFDLNAYKAAYGGNSSDTDFIFKGGRDFVYWANGLVLAQTLDGITFDVTNPYVDAEMVAGVTITRTVDFDPSRPDFDHNTRRGFYGVMLSKQIESHRPFIYGLIQRDYNSKNESQTGAITTKFDYNSYYLGAGSAGNIGDRIRYGVEAALELGNTLSNSFQIAQGALAPVEQTRNNIVAMGLDARLDYLLQDAHHTRLSAEAILASGDPDRGSSNTTFNGNHPGTDDGAFNAFGLINTGLAFAPSVSNLEALRIGASTFPFTGPEYLRRLQVGTDFLVFAKMRRTAPIDETTADEKFLGWEPDVYLNWQIASDVTLAVRYGAFFPNTAAFPVDQTRQFFYTGVTFAF